MAKENIKRPGNRGTGNTVFYDNLAKAINRMGSDVAEKRLKKSKKIQDVQKKIKKKK